MKEAFSLSLLTRAFGAASRRAALAGSLAVALGAAWAPGAARAQSPAGLNPLAASGLGVAPGQVETGKSGGNYFDYTAPQGGVPSDLNERVGIDQKLDERVPMGLEFRNERGETVNLGSFFGSKPVMITMLQMTCDQICSAQFGAMSASFNELAFTPGQEFEVITVSIDPNEGPLIAADAKAEQLRLYPRPGADKGWHFLTGSQENIQALASAIGFKYIWHEESRQYIHPDGIVLATPEGRISRYFLQLDYHPRDLRFSLIEASNERIGSFLDRIALSCFHYDPVMGKYSFQIMAFLRLGALAFVLGGALAIGLMVSWERKRGASLARDAASPSSSSPGKRSAPGPVA